MRRHQALVRLSREHHHGLVMALRIEKELEHAGAEAINRLYSDLIAFWAAGLLPHFRGENECLLARLVRHVSPDDELVRRTQRDHLGMEALVATMRDSVDLTVRKEALQQFGGWLREHIRWEEEVLFERTQTQLSKEELNALREDIEEQLPAISASPWGVDPPHSP